MLKQYMLHWVVFAKHNLDILQFNAALIDDT